jgi:dsRNA-specific ribonuclease
MSSSKLVKRQNTLNQLITAEDVETILRSNGLDIKVNNINIYQKAFVHRSYLKNNYGEEVDLTCVSLQDSCNETYEFLGDTILNAVVGSYLYERFPMENEGFLTKTRTKMVRGTSLGQLAKRLNFGKWVIISQHVDSEGGRENLRILEDLFESFIAAIYLDNGSDPLSSEWFKMSLAYDALQKELDSLEKDLNVNLTALAPALASSPAHSLAPLPVEKVKRYMELTQQSRKLAKGILASRSNGYLYCQKFIMNTYEKFIDIVKLIVFDDNYKDQLQTYFQKKHDMFPTWKVIKEEGKTNQRWHTIGVHDRCGFLIGTGRDRKKTDAEQIASRNALIYLGVISEDYGNDFFR